MNSSELYSSLREPMGKLSPQPGIFHRAKNIHAPLKLILPFISVPDNVHAFCHDELIWILCKSNYTIYTPLFLVWLFFSQHNNLDSSMLCILIVCFFLLLSSILCVCVCSKSLQLCLTLCDPMDCSSPGSFVHGILQPRILEWIAMLFSRGSSWSRDRIFISYFCCIGRWVLYH